ncbi:hypothetical protein BKA93DRAFT_768300 [Sparassis latifolia]
MMIGGFGVQHSRFSPSTSISDLKLKPRCECQERSRSLSSLRKILCYYPIIFMTMYSNIVCEWTTPGLLRIRNWPDDALTGIGTGHADAAPTPNKYFTLKSGGVSVTGPILYIVPWDNEMQEGPQIRLGLFAPWRRSFRPLTGHSSPLFFALGLEVAFANVSRLRGVRDVWIVCAVAALVLFSCQCQR